MLAKLLKIKVLGTGGAGGNAINDMISSDIADISFIATNTDIQDLSKSLAETRLQLGEKLTKGLGAGANPDIGKLSAEEDYLKLKEILEDTDLLFITAGMGGGTGTGSAPVIAKIAKELGILSIAIITKPFAFEGSKRKINAEKGIEELRKYVDSIVIIPNDKLFELPDKTITLKNAFKEANNILRIGIVGIINLILGNGLINLDFADVKTILKDSDIATLGFGRSEGQYRVKRATDLALNSPLLEKSIQGASKILINITGSSNLKLEEAYEITNIIKEAAGKLEDDVLFGVNIDDSLGDFIEVTLIANNFLDETKKEVPKLIHSPKINKETPFDFNLEIDLPPWIRNGRLVK